MTDLGARKRPSEMLSGSDERAWIRPISAIIAATVMMVFWALITRQFRTGEAVELEALGAFSFDPYFFGLAALEFAIPLLLVLLLSRTALFRRAITASPATKRDQIWLFLGFSGIQIVFFLYKYTLLTVEEAWVSWGYFVVVVAALTGGGWRPGVAVGAVTAVCWALFDYAEWQFWADDVSVTVSQFVIDWLLFNAQAVAAVWVGFVVGIWAGWRAERRFALGPTMGFGAAVELTTFVILFASTAYAEYVAETLVSNVVISLIALAVFLIVVRTALDEALRLRAESDRLTLAETQLELTQTQLALTEAELRALHAQINPHFFFNALNTIRYFIRTNPEQARNLLANLSDVFQRVMSAGEYVPLSDEIETVRAYLALEQARLEERLTVIWSVLAQDMLAVQVPTLILQPLVENAVVHGVASSVDGGSIHIVVNRVGADLFIQVQDDGPGFDVAAVMDGAVSAETDPADRQRQPIGLRNIDQRLRRYYGDAYSLHLDSTADRGTTAVIRIPLEQS